MKGKKSFLSNLLLLAIAGLLLLITSCDPPPPKITSYTPVSFTLSDTSQQIKKGDTLKVRFTIPKKLKLANGNSITVNSIYFDPAVITRSFKDTNCGSGENNAFLTDKGLYYFAQFYNKGLTNDTFHWEAYFVAKDTGVFEIEIYLDGFIKVKSDQGDLNVGFAPRFDVSDLHIPLLVLHCSKLSKEPYYSAYNNGRHYAFRVIP